MSVDVHYTVDGPEDGPVVVLSGSLGSRLDMWDPQMAGLTGQFRVVRYDLRGHGSSPVPPAPYTMADLGSDVLRLLDRLKVERAHFAGLSIGGMTGMWLAANAPERIDRLALLCTSATPPGTPEAWEERIRTVRTQGTAAIAPTVVSRWFTPAYAERDPETVSLFIDMIANTDEGTWACNAIRPWTCFRAAFDHRAHPGRGGQTDPTSRRSTPSSSRRASPTRMEVIPDAAHLASWSSDLRQRTAPRPLRPVVRCCLKHGVHTAGPEAARAARAPLERLGLRRSGLPRGGGLVSRRGQHRGALRCGLRGPQ